MIYPKLGTVAEELHEKLIRINPLFANLTKDDFTFVARPDQHTVDGMSYNSRLYVSTKVSSGVECSVTLSYNRRPVSIVDGITGRVDVLPDNTFKLGEGTTQVYTENGFADAELYTFTSNAVRTLDDKDQYAEQYGPYAGNTLINTVYDGAVAPMVNFRRGGTELTDRLPTTVIAPMYPYDASGSSRGGLRMNSKRASAAYGYPDVNHAGRYIPFMLYGYDISPVEDWITGDNYTWDDTSLEALDYVHLVQNIPYRYRKLSTSSSHIDTEGGTANKGGSQLDRSGYVWAGGGNTHVTCIVSFSTAFLDEDGVLSSVDSRDVWSHMQHVGGGYGLYINDSMYSYYFTNNTATYDRMFLLRTPKAVE